MSLRAHMALAVLASLCACSDARRTSAPPPPPDPRIAVVDELLRPGWLKGMKWTLEVHGKAQHHGGWAPFWGKAYYQVWKVEGERAEVLVDFVPIVRKLGGTSPRAADDDLDEAELHRSLGQFGDGGCQARLTFKLPWRLVDAKLTESIDTERDPRKLKVTSFGPSEPPRTGTSPCIPLVPRHPTLLPSLLAVPKGPQSVEVRTHEARFTIHEASFRRITWIEGQPWWALMESVGASRTAVAMVDDRRPDHAEVFRARLIEVDGHAVEPLPWSHDENWLRDGWPAGGVKESELPPAHPLPALPGATAP